MPDLNQRLAEIRELQGKSPLPNPNQISGFGPQDPPPPTRIQDIQEDPEYPAGWLDPEEEIEAPPSPLVPRTAVREPDAALIVLDAKAQFRGRPVRLTEKEQAAVIRIVLRSIQRDAAEQLQSLPRK